MTFLSMILATSAFILLALATLGHQRKRFGKPLNPLLAKRLRGLGWAALAMAFPPAILAQGWIFGPILWVGGLMLGAGVSFLLFNFLPERKF